MSVHLEGRAGKLLLLFPSPLLLQVLTYPLLILRDLENYFQKLKSLLKYHFYLTIEGRKERRKRVREEGEEEKGKKEGGGQRKVSHSP